MYLFLAIFPQVMEFALIVIFNEKIIIFKNAKFNLLILFKLTLLLFIANHFSQ